MVTIKRTFVFRFSKQPNLLFISLIALLTDFTSFVPFIVMFVLLPCLCLTEARCALMNKYSNVQMFKWKEPHEECVNSKD